MKHKVSFLQTDTSKIQEAVKQHAPKDYISSLKAQMSWGAVYGFQHSQVDFKQLKLMLSMDYAFSPFIFKEVDKGAIYDKDKHPQAWGGIRGKHNLNHKLSWICLDIDKTRIEAKYMHYILQGINHHIALTSNRANKYKYRVIIELDKEITISDKEWKPFIKSLSTYIQCPDVDFLGPGALLYGYKGRTVLSVLDKDKVSPDRHLNIAKMKVAEFEEKKAEKYQGRTTSELLKNRYSTFYFAYERNPKTGRTATLIAVIEEALLLGATRPYIIELTTSINNFWDDSLSLALYDRDIMRYINNEVKE